MTQERAVVLGAGPVGVALVHQLVAKGAETRVVTRSGRASVPDEVEIVPADISDSAQAIAACANATTVYSCVGLTYQGWPEKWPPMMTGTLEGAVGAGARFIFMDNCYMYGPVTVPMTEDLPLTDYGRQTGHQSQDRTRMWQQAHESGRVEAASVRASDFYGPGVKNAALGDLSVGRMAKGKSAQIVGDPDQPHSFAYVPDVARALITVGEADDAMGQAWNVPKAPDKTVREILQMFADEFDTPLKIQTMPKPLMSVLGLFDADIRELKEMLYRWQRPFHVDATKFTSRFWDDPTPWPTGIAETAASYTR